MQVQMLLAGDMEVLSEMNFLSLEWKRDRWTSRVFVYFGHKGESSFRCLRCLNNTARRWKEKAFAE